MLINNTLNTHGNCFTVPNEIYNLGLSMGAIAVNGFLLRLEDRHPGKDQYTCHPSYKTIGGAVGRSARFGDEGDALGYGLGLIAPDVSAEARVQMILRMLAEQDTAREKQRKRRKKKRESHSLTSTAAPARKARAAFVMSLYL